jgi:hypothetical protein
VAAYAVGWIPYVGWLAPQIPIFYNFGERIARSITYTIANGSTGTSASPRLDQSRRRHGQRVHPTRHRPMELLAVAAVADESAEESQKKSEVEAVKEVKEATSGASATTNDDPGPKHAKKDGTGKE